MILPTKHIRPECRALLTVGADIRDALKLDFVQKSTFRKRRFGPRLVQGKM